MALDKIFIHRRDISFSEVQEDSSDIEYLRKDALLEWAKKELESAENTNFDEFGSGEVVAWRHIVDKLNKI